MRYKRKKRHFLTIDTQTRLIYHAATVGVSIRASLNKTSSCQFPKLVCFTIDFCKTMPYNDVKIKHTKGAMKMENIKVTVGNQVFENVMRIEFYAGLGNEVGFTVTEKDGETHSGVYGKANIQIEKID